MSQSPLRLAMLGMIPGNGHPYSWAAIINGYDPVEMAKCPYAGIPVYLGKQPLESVRIPEAQVTHIWTDDPEDAPLVARASKIPHVVKKMEDVIGEVDAVVITTDDGADHVRRVRPFVEAGLPVFVDKPMAVTRTELSQFIAWRKSGARILSSSGMRYAPELAELSGEQWRWITAFTCKTWERYGIHMVEPLFKLLGPGFESVRSEAKEGSDIVYLSHRSGTQATVAAIYDAAGSFGALHAYGNERHQAIQMADTYSAFRGQMLAMVNWLQSGKEPYSFEETVEMMCIIIAGVESRGANRQIPVAEIRNAVEA